MAKEFELVKIYKALFAADKLLMRQLYLRNITFLFFFVFAGVIQAQDVCEKHKRIAKNEQCQEKSYREINEIKQAIHRTEWAKKQSRSLDVEVKRQKNRLAEMLRAQRDGESSNYGKQQLQALLSDYDQLKNVVTRINEIVQQQAICYSSCSANRRVELDDQYQILQKEKIEILAKEPLLLHPDIEKSLQQGERTEQHKKAIISTLSDHAVELAKLSSSLEKVIDDPAEPIGFARNKSEMINYTADMAAEHRQALEFIVADAYPYELDRDEQANWCYFKSELDYLRKRDLAIHLGGEVALWGASFLVNPPGTVAGRLFQMGSRTAQWGLRATNTVKSIITSGSLAGKAEHRYLEARSRADAVADFSKNGLWNWSRGQSMQSYKVSEHEYFAVYDLGRAGRLSDKDVLQTSQRYWEHVGKVYSERLNFSQEKIKSYIKTSDEFKNRTFLITSTDKNPIAATTFKGGAGVVVSRGQSELLPLEMATGERVDRSLGGVAEVVRLTAQKEDAKGLSKDLIKTAAEIVKSEKNIQTIYVYTSKAHSRLYKGMGVPVQSEKSLGNGNVILTIRVSDISQ